MNPRQAKSETDFQRALEDIEMIFNAPSGLPDLAELEQLGCSGDGVEPPPPTPPGAVQGEPNQPGP